VIAARFGHDKATVNRVVIRSMQKEGYSISKEGSGRPYKILCYLQTSLKRQIKKNPVMTAVDQNLSLPELSSI
jgi:hypothetical protein